MFEIKNNIIGVVGVEFIHNIGMFIIFCKVNIFNINLFLMEIFNM